MKHLLILLILGLTAACSGTTEDATATVAKAEAALADGDIAEAVSLSNRLCSSDDTARLGWREYCRLATIYAVAYDNNVDAEASMSAAARCYGRAVAIQPDSAASFTPAPEYYSMYMTARHVFDGLSMDPADIRDHDGDTVEHAEDETEQH